MGKKKRERQHANYNKIKMSKMDIPDYRVASFIVPKCIRNLNAEVKIS